MMFYVVGSKLMLLGSMLCDLLAVKPGPIMTMCLWPLINSDRAADVASTYDGVIRTCGLRIFRSELHLC